MSTNNENIIKLKIKLKSLAAESRIIRKEELKNKGKWSHQANDLHYHRVHYLRPITRATHIAYGLLRGMEYLQIEPTSKSQPNWDKVKAMITKYSNWSNQQDNLKTLDELIYNLNVLDQAA